MQVGNTSFETSHPNITQPNTDIVLGTFVDINASQALFPGAGDNFDIEDRVMHVIDFSGAGFVSG